MKKVAVSYKGKHFCLQDEDTVEPHDFVDDYVDVEKIVSNPDILRAHVDDLLAYIDSIK